MSLKINVRGPDNFGVGTGCRCNPFGTIWAKVLLLSVSICILISGCRDVATIWTIEVLSPDGQWHAVARTDEYGGPGTAGLQTIVSLRASKGSQTPIQILLFTQNEKSIDLQMKWLSPSHLEVTYNGHPSLDFQAIKCAGIDISVRDLSSNTMNSSQ
jgi:hypothetical protein